MCCYIRRLSKLRWSSWIIVGVYSMDLETEIRQEARHRENQDTSSSSRRSTVERALLKEHRNREYTEPRWGAYVDNDDSHRLRRTEQSLKGICIGK